VHGKHLGKTKAFGRARGNFVRSVISIFTMNKDQLNDQILKAFRYAYMPTAFGTYFPRSLSLATS
jgi:hypothetical protein